MNLNRLLLTAAFITVAYCYSYTAFLSQVNFSKETLVVSSLDTLQIIGIIKKQFVMINANAAKYNQIEKDILGQSAEGGVLMAFYEKNDLKKVITTFYGESGKAVTEYYFNNGELCFAFKKNYFYDKPIYIEGAKIKSTEEWRYYFFNNELLRWLDNANKQIPPISKKFQDENKYMKEDVGNLKKTIGDYKLSDTQASQGDTVRCKYGVKCPDTGYIIRGTRGATGRVIHVNPKNKNVPIEK